jgi:hypothetical protein
MKQSAEQIRPFAATDRGSGIRSTKSEGTRMQDVINSRRAPDPLIPEKTLTFYTGVGPEIAAL